MGSFWSDFGQKIGQSEADIEFCFIVGHYIQTVLTLRGRVV